MKWLPEKICDFLQYTLVFMMKVDMKKKTIDIVITKQELCKIITIVINVKCTIKGRIKDFPLGRALKIHLSGLVKRKKLKTRRTKKYV